MIAIAIPAYNRPDCLRAALKSLEIQTYRKFFTIVVDDCSTEDLKSICDASSLNITYLRQEKNVGPAAARQRAIDICAKNRIEFIMFLDSDDLLSPYAIQQLYYEITHSNLDMVSSHICCEGIHKPNSSLHAPDNLTWLHGKIYRISALINNNISFNTNLRTNEDLDFNLKIRMSNLKIGYIDETTYLLRTNVDSICRGESEFSVQVNTSDYIRAIESSTTWAIEHGYDIRYNMINILNCYLYYQSMLIQNLDIKEVDIILKKLYNYIEVKDKLKDRYYWMRYNPRQYIFLDKKIKFFPQTLSEWLEYIGVTNEDLCS